MVGFVVEKFLEDDFDRGGRFMEQAAAGRGGFSSETKSELEVDARVLIMVDCLVWEDCGLCELHFVAVY